MYNARAYNPKCELGSGGRAGLGRPLDKKRASMADTESQQASTIAAFAADFKVKSGKPLCQAILAAINHPQLYVFGELLSQPNVKALQGTEDAKYFEMMEIFATGTLQEYKDKGAISDGVSGCA
jgi:hypothetical protein